MATKYWGPSAGGSSTGTWDASSVTNWFDNLARTVRSTVAPTSADDVVFDAASDNGAIFTVTVSTGAVCRDITAGSLDFTMTLAGTAAWSIYGSLTFPATNFTRTYTGNITFSSTTTGKTITTNGVSLASAITFNGVGGSWALGSAFTVSATVTLTNGAIDLNNNNLTALIFSSNNSNARSIAFSTGKIILTGNNSTVWSCATLTGFTYTGNPTIELNYSGSTGTRTIGHGLLGTGNESNAVTFNISAGTDIISLPPNSGGNAVKNLNFTGFSGTYTSGASRVNLFGNLTLSSGMTLSVGTDTLNFAATSGTQTITSNGKTIDNPVTKSGAGAMKLQDALTLGATRSFTHTAGTLDLNSKTLTVGSFSSTGTVARDIKFSAGGLIVDLGTWTASGSNLTTSGMGSISMTSSSAKNFDGGGFSYPTLNQGGAGDLTITGANRFKDMTNTVQPCVVKFPANTDTNVENFSMNGTPGNLVSLRSSTAGQKFNLVKV